MWFPEELTLVIAPSLSEAIAETVMFAGALKVPLFAGP